MSKSYPAKDGFKICSKCKRNLLVEDNFHKRALAVDGYLGRCKVCVKKERTSDPKKVQRKLEVDRKRYHNRKNTPEYKEYLKEYNSRADVIKRKKEYRKKYFEENAEEIKRKQRIYAKKNKEKIKIKNKGRREQINKTRRKWETKAYKNNTQFRITKLLRGRIKSALDGKAKSSTTKDLIGCSIEHLTEHLQKTAIDNGYKDFDINNYSGEEYHIDHIKPCATFDLKYESEQKKCFHYTNLQILSATENVSKGAKYES